MNWSPIKCASKYSITPFRNCLNSSSVMASVRWTAFSKPSSDENKIAFSPSISDGAKRCPCSSIGIVPTLIASMTLWHMGCARPGQPMKNSNCDNASSQSLWAMGCLRESPTITGRLNWSGNFEQAGIGSHTSENDCLSRPSKSVRVQTPNCAASCRFA